MMHPVHQRLAELSAISSKRAFSLSEAVEFNQCLKANLSMAYEDAKIRNLSVIASECNDVDWQHEICARIEKGSFQ
jgi:hypothetical protein